MLRSIKSRLFQAGLAAFALLGGLSCAHDPFLLKPDDPRTGPALESLRRASETGQAKTLTDYGWALWMQRNDTKGALAAWERAAKTAPKHAEPPFAMGLARYFMGDIPASARDFAESLGRDPGGPFAETAAGFLYEFNEHVGDFPGFVTPLCEKLLDDPRVNAATRRTLTSLLRRLKREAGDREADQRLKSREGKLNRYAVYGPFGQFGLLDMEKSFGPETDVKETYKDQDRDITPLVFDLNKMEARLEDCFDDSGVFYAVSYVKLAAPAKVMVTLSTRDRAMLFMDGARLLDIDSLKNYPRPVHRAVMKLNAGWHRLVLKMADLTPRIQFFWELTDENGLPLAFENQAELPPDYAAVPPTLATLPPSTETHWLAELEKEKNFRTLFMAFLTEFKLRDHAKAKEILEQAMALNDRFAPLYILRALLMEEDPSLPRRVTQDQARTDFRRAVELDSDQALAVYQLANDDIERDRQEEAVQKLRALAAKLPGYFLWNKGLFSIYNRNGWAKEIDEAAAAALTQNPRNLSLLKDLYSYRRSHSQFVEARKLAEAIDRLEPKEAALADWHEEQGELDKARKGLLEALRWEPASTGLRSRLADLELKRGKADTAVAILEDLARIPGLDRTMARKLSDAYAMASKNDKASAVLAETLKKDPGNWRIRSSLAFREGRSLLDGFTANGEELVREFMKENWKPEAGAVIVLDEYVTEVLPDGATIGRTHIITRVQTKEAQVQYGEIAIPGGAEVVLVRVLKPDGRILVPERIDGKSSITMPDLDVGDFVEYDYIQGQEKDIQLNGGRLMNARFVFQNQRVPTYRSRFIVVRSKDLALHFFPMNYALNAPQEEEKDGRRITRYYNERIEALIPEPFMPFEQEVTPSVQISLAVSWEETRDIHRQRLVAAKRPSLELERFLAKHRKAGEDEEQAVERLYYAIAETIEGEDQDNNFFSPVGHILAERKGNRLLLLSALLDRIGIQNDFLMVRPRTLKDYAWPDASLRLYEDALLRVSLKNGKRLYLDANYKESVFNEPSPLFSDTQALVLNDGREGLFTRLPVWTPIGHNREVDLYLKLAANGSAEAEASERVRGYYSVSYRRELKKLSPDQVPVFFEMVLNKTFTGSHLTKVNILNLDDPKKPLELRYSFTVRQLARPIGSLLRIDGSFFPLNLLYTYVRLPVRNFPLLVNGFDSGYNTTIIELPAGSQAKSYPKATIIDTPFGVYRFGADLSGQKLSFTRDFVIPIQRVELDGYMNFARFCSAVDHLEREDILIGTDATKTAALE